MSERGTSGKRGRPPLTAEDQDRMRAQIAAAAVAVFAEHGYQGVTVTRILDRAGISRPTFYRYYRNAQEPLVPALEEVGWSAVHRITAATKATEGDIAKVMAGIDEYVQWSVDNRSVMPSLHASIFDDGSPIADMRRATLAAATQLLVDELAAAGRPAVPRIVIEIYVTTNEYICYRLHLDTPGGEADIRLAKTLMLRNALAMIGNRQDWETLAKLPGVDYATDTPS
jgi:TetR/AcrR family transcriptional regulator